MTHRHDAIDDSRVVPLEKHAERRRRNDKDDREREVDKDAENEGPDLDEERDPRDPLQTLVPAGEYVLGYVNTQRMFAFNRPVFAVTLKIVEPAEHSGKLLLRFYNDMSKKAKLARSSSLARDFEAITGLVAPRKPFHPHRMLAGALVLGAVVTVETRPGPGGRQKILPAAWYSKIDRIIRVVDGTPACMEGREPSHPRGGR